MGTGEDSQEQRESSDGSSAEDSFKNLMDLKECLQDSPNFRQQLRSREQEINDLEQKLEKVVSMCDKMVSTGNSYMESSRCFSVSLKELSSHFEETEVVKVTLRKFYEMLSELQSYYSVLFDQAQSSIQATLRAYLSGELRKVKETKKSFHRVSEELSVAINRNGHTPKSKSVEAEEASIHLLTVQNQFSHLAVDYSYHVNAITCNKGYEIIHSVLEFMRAQFSLFHQGYDLLLGFDPFMKQVAEQVDVLRKNATTLMQEMQTRHNLVSLKYLQEDAQAQDESLSPMDNPSLPIQLSGYLFKRPQSSNNPFKSWSRRWFILNENKLVYQSESKEEEHVTVAEDLRICTVKLAEDLERRFCFEVVTPSRSCMLQADSEMLRKRWLSYLEAGIVRALRISISSRTHEEMEDNRKRSMVASGETHIHILSHSPIGGRTSDFENMIHSILFDFLEAPGNDQCADCGNSKPTWASINLGIMLCIECSGIHRGMGVHISKVRSVTLDDWEPELQQIMCALGNARVNAIYEYDMPTYVKKPTSESSMAERETYIRQKYIRHAFVQSHPDFKRPTTPVTPISIPELLTPVRGPISLASPKSSNKRSFSPASMRRHMRSPRLSKQRFNSQPSSSTSCIADQFTPTGSEEDLWRTESCEQGSGLYLLAENFRKMEDREKKMGGAKSNWGSSLGDKLKIARRSSKRISNYAMSKFGEGQDSLMKRLKKPVKDRGGREMLTRDTLSDTEEDTLKTGTPLLFSLSASSHNLSMGGESVQSLEIPVPPPKPPRTFKIKSLYDLTLDDEDEDEEDLLDCEENNFSSDVFSAIKQVGVVCTTSPDSGIGNGRIPASSTPSTLNVEGNVMIRSESSPQLSRFSLTPSLNVNKDPCSNRNSVSESLAVRLQTISEDSTDSAHIEKLGSDEHNISPLPHSSPIVTQEDRLVHSAPLRRKHPLTSHTSMDNSAAASVYSNSNGHAADMSLDLSLTTLSKAELSPTPELTKHFSMISITSAEYYSAESSDVSKPNSVSPSPDLFTKSLESRDDGTYFDIPFQYGVGGEGCVVRSASCGGTRRSGEGTDILSPSLSMEDESFNTPPSSPSTPSPNANGHVTTTDNAEGSHVTNDVNSSVVVEIMKPELQMDSSPANGHLTTTDNAEGSHVTNDVNSSVVVEIMKPELQMDSSPANGHLAITDNVEGSHVINGVNSSVVVEIMKPELQMEDSSPANDHPTTTDYAEGSHVINDVNSTVVVEIMKPELQMEDSSPANDHPTTTDNAEGSHVINDVNSTVVVEIMKPELQMEDSSPANDHPTTTDNVEGSHVINDVNSSVVVEIMKPELQMEDTADHELNLVFSDGPKNITAAGPDPSKENMRKRNRSYSNSDTYPECEEEKKGGGEGEDEGQKLLPTSKNPKFEIDYGVDRVVPSRIATVPISLKEDLRKRTFTTPNIDTLPSACRGRGGHRMQPNSKDGKFEAEDGLIERSQSTSDILVSAFSMKDLEDILGRRTGSDFLLQSHIPTVSEEQHKEEEKGKGLEEEKKEELEKEMVVAELTPEVESEKGGEERDVELELSLGCYTITIPDSVTPELFLFSSVIEGNLPGILCALAHGSSVNFINQDEECRTPILQAIYMGSNVIVEYLYLNGAKLSAIDGLGKGSLHYAAVLEDSSLVMMLLKRGAIPGIKDLEGKDPIAYALDGGSPDIVTMLRMAMFRADSSASDGRQSQSLDELESEFFRDVGLGHMVNSGIISKRTSTPSLDGSSSLDSK